MDIPQLFTAHKIDVHNIRQIEDIFEKIDGIKKYIYGIHLWGKKKDKTGRKISHVGNLNDYFEHDEEAKRVFLDCFKRTFNDEILRYFVLEVNSNRNDLYSIVNDLKTAGVEFV